jgi:hypothetical protein
MDRKVRAYLVGFDIEEIHVDSFYRRPQRERKGSENFVMRPDFRSCLESYLPLSSWTVNRNPIETCCPFQRTSYSDAFFRHPLGGRFPVARLLRSLLLLTLAWRLSGERVRSAESFKCQSGETQTALLELFTSEGCSSCPAAEAWLSQLAQSPKVWKEIVPVAFHVTLWDRRGWKDPFAAKSFTQRHDNYAGAWRRDSIYTPCFAWNGAEWRGWEKDEALPRAPARVVGVLTARSEDQRKWLIEFNPEGVENGKYSANAALLGFGLSSNVKAGENQGTSFIHDFVVLAFAEKSLRRGDGGFRSELVLKPTHGFSPKRTAVAAWVTSARNGQPVQALGAWLDSAGTRAD